MSLVPFLSSITTNKTSRERNATGIITEAKAQSFMNTKALIRNISEGKEQWIILMMQGVN